jgi:fibronectin type 3 domain-containing protein
MLDGGEPTKPTSLTAVKSSTNEITLSWTAATDGTGVAGYTIYRATSKFGEYVEIGTTTSLTYIDTGLSTGTYYYVVIAFDGAENESPTSDQGMATL